MSRHAPHLLVLSLLSSLSACEPEGGEPELAPDALEPRAPSKADDVAELVVHDVSGGFVIDAHGSIALDLYEAMIAAGTFATSTADGVHLVLGGRLGCAMEGGAAACQLDPAVSSSRSPLRSPETSAIDASDSTASSVERPTFLRL